MLIIGIYTPCLQALMYYWAGKLIFWHLHRTAAEFRPALLRSSKSGFHFFMLEFLLLSIELGILGIFLTHANSFSDRFATSRMPGKLDPPYLLTVAVTSAAGPAFWWFVAVRYLSRCCIQCQWVRLLFLTVCGFWALFLDIVMISIPLFLSSSKEEQSQYRWIAVTAGIAGLFLMVAGYFTGKLAVKFAEKPAQDVEELKDAAS